MKPAPWLTAAELAAAGLANWPGSEFRSRAKCEKLGLPSRIREGSRGGGGREYDTAALPPEFRRALITSQLRAAAGTVDPGASVTSGEPDVCAAPPALRGASSALVPAPAAARPPSRLQSECADARAHLVTHLRGLAETVGMTRATEALAQALAAGTAAPELMQVAAVANQRRRTAEGGVLLSARTLFRWVGEHRKGGWLALCPSAGKAEPLAALGDDVATVLSRYASTSGAARNLTQVARDVNVELGRPFDDWAALYNRARRALPKVDKTRLIKARHTGAERAAKLPYKHRITDHMAPNDAWVIDGHTFKAKVRHPDHGRPFAPEVTLAIDVVTRRIVGWSACLSENVRGVAACIHSAISLHGLPGIVYSDNGAGETAKPLDCPVVGIYKRFDIDHRTGIPGHPQGHGLIERSWQTHMIRVARKFATYQGADADSGTVRVMRGRIDQENRALERARTSGEVVQLNGRIPSWNQFLDAVSQAVNDYNAQHRHRGLAKHQAGEHFGKRMTPDEAWAAMAKPELVVRLQPFELAMLALPSVVRTAQRGQIEFLGQFYFGGDALMQVDGERVRVDYAVHDGSRVWIWTLDGSFVCEAPHYMSAKGNSIPYFAPSVIDQARRRRVEGIERRRMAQIELAKRELQPTLPAPLAAHSAFHIPAAQVPADMAFVERVPAELPAKANTRPQAFDSASDRYEWLMQHRGEAGFAPEDLAWLASYATGSEYLALHDYYASRGLAWPEDPSVFKTAG